LFGISGGEVLCRDPEFRRYSKPEAALDYIKQDIRHFLEHYPKVRRKLLSAIELARAHNAEVEQLKRNIEAFITEQTEKSGKIGRHLLLSGIISLILFDLFDYQGFLDKHIKERDRSIGANNTLMIGGFGIAKLPNDNNKIRQEIIDKIYSFLASLYGDVRTKYSDMVTTKIEEAKEILSKIKNISRDIANILRRYKTTGKFDGKCSECPKLIKYLIPPW